MKCPKCGGDAPDFRTKDAQVINFCRGCGGTWFDNGELAELLVSDQNSFTRYIEDGAVTPFACPRDQTPLKEIRYHPDHDLMIDVCESCHGVFLDAKETGKAERIAAHAETAKGRLTRAVGRIKEAGYVPLSDALKK